MTFNNPREIVACDECGLPFDGSRRAVLTFADGRVQQYHVMCAPTFIIEDVIPPGEIPIQDAPHWVKPGWAGTTQTEIPNLLTADIPRLEKELKAFLGDRSEYGWHCDCHIVKQDQCDTCVDDFIMGMDDH